MIRVNEHESFETALAAFTQASKPILSDAQRRTHFTPDRAKQHKRAKSAGGNRQRNGRKPRGKR